MWVFLLIFGATVPHRILRTATCPKYAPQVLQAAASWDEIQSHIYWEAEYLGQYLAYLSDLEDAGKMPDVFRPHPGGVTERSVARQFELGKRMLISMDGNRMDDFPFQLSRMVQRRGRDERWYTTQHLLKELIVPILDGKGYDGEQEAKNPLPSR